MTAASNGDTTGGSGAGVATDQAGTGEELARLRSELEQARAAEAQVRALLQAASAFYLADGVEAIFTELARSAVAELGLAEASTYRYDHDKGRLDGVVRAVAEGEGQVRLEGLEEVIPADAGHPVAAFVGGRLAAASDNEVVVLPPGDRILVKMTPLQAQSNGLVVGVLSATTPAQAMLGQRELELLRTLVRLATGATEHARIERLRTQLISSVSHELRTPLASIRAYTELIADGDAGPTTEEQRLFLKRIEDTTGRLERLVDDLLDLSRLRAGELSVHKSVVDVAAAIEHTVNALQPEAMRGDITLTTRLDPDLPLIYTDPDRLCQVLFNLAGNAVKYVGQGGKVEVWAEVRDRDTEGATLYIAVSDNGPGIAPEDLDKIFDEFQRGRGAEAISKGAGLGLAIAARLTRLLGGEIGVESRLGEGSTFYLRFPMRALNVP